MHAARTPRRQLDRTDSITVCRVASPAGSSRSPRRSRSTPSATSAEVRALAEKAIAFYGGLVRASAAPPLDVNGWLVGVGFGCH